MSAAGEGSSRESRPAVRAARDIAGHGLYRRLLGPRWDALGPAVRRAHADGGELVGVGTFVVEHGVGPLVRLLVGCNAAPPISDACPVRVTVRPSGRGELWHRQLAAMRLVTVQRADARGVLIERLGPLEFRFRLAVADGELVYRQVGLELRLGRARFRVPNRLAPRVSAQERADADGISTNVSVVVTTPAGALLFSYGGRVRWAASGAAGRAVR